MSEKTYSDTEVAAKLKEHGLADWYLEDGWLRRKYNTEGWPHTLMAVNAVGYVCEAAYHHADLAVTWGNLWVQHKTSQQMPRTTHLLPHQQALPSKRTLCPLMR